MIFQLHYQHNSAGYLEQSGDLGEYKISLKYIQLSASLNGTKLNVIFLSFWTLLCMAKQNSLLPYSGWADQYANDCRNAIKCSRVGLLFIMTFHGRHLPHIQRLHGFKGTGGMIMP